MDMNLAIETLREFVENTDNAKVKDAILELHPALCESKDEKIRKKMVEHFKNKTKKTWCNIPVEDIISYLEKQKELPFVKDIMLGYPTIYFYDGERMHFQGNPAMEEKQKKQERIVPEREATDFEIEVHEIIAQARSDKRLADKDVLEQFEKEASCALMWKAEKQLRNTEKQKEQNPVYDEDNYRDVKEKTWNKYLEKNPSSKGFKNIYCNGFSEGYQFGVHEEKPLRWTEHDEAVRKETIACLEKWKSIIPSRDLIDYNNILGWLKSELSIHNEKQKVQKSAEIAPNQFDVTCGMQGLIAAFSAIPTIDEYPKDPVTSRAYSLMTRFEEIIRRGFLSMCGSSTCVNDVIVRETAQECVEVISTEKSEDNPEKSKVPVEPADIYANEIVKWENAHPDWNKDRMRATALHFFKLRQKWSEEDEKQLNWFYRLLDFIGEEFPSTWGQNHKGGKEWLKSLRPQPKHEWSEEEKDKLNSIERLIVNANAHGNNLIGDKEAIDLQHFIRSIVKPTNNLAEWSEEEIVNWLKENFHVSSFDNTKIVTKFSSMDDLIKSFHKRFESLLPF